MPRSCRATFEAYRVASGDNIFRLRPIDDAAFPRAAWQSRRVLKEGIALYCHPVWRDSGTFGTFSINRCIELVVFTAISPARVTAGIRVGMRVRGVSCQLRGIATVQDSEPDPLGAGTDSAIHQHVIHNRVFLKYKSFCQGRSSRELIPRK